MDDELPLTALAKPKKSNFDDDLPLAKLATSGGKPSIGRPSAGRPSVGGQAPGAAGKPKPKGLKKGGSSSSSDSSSYTSSDSSSASGGKKKTAATKKSRIRLLAKKRAEQEEGADNADNTIKKKDRTPKEQVVVDLLCRWWYANGGTDWPPSDPAYYDAELAKRSFRRVSIQEWEWVPEVDDKGRHKVYELSQFKGVFRNQAGDAVDIRPMDSCPSYANYMKKDMPELYTLLVSAYENQIKDLPTTADEKPLMDSLKTALNRIREKAHQANQMAFATGGATKKARV